MARLLKNIIDLFHNLNLEFELVVPHVLHIYLDTITSLRSKHHTSRASKTTCLYVVPSNLRNPILNPSKNLESSHRQVQIVLINTTIG